MYNKPVQKLDKLLDGLITFVFSKTFPNGKIKLCVEKYSCLRYTHKLSAYAYA